MLVLRALKGLLESYRAAVGDPTAQWENITFSTAGVRGRDEKLAARPCFQERGCSDDHIKHHTHHLDTHLVTPEWEIRRCSKSFVAKLHLPTLTGVDGAELVLMEQSLSFSVGDILARVALPEPVDVLSCNDAKFSRRTRMLRVRAPILKAR